MSRPTCSGCHAIIRWLKTEAGRNAPVDPTRLQEWIIDEKPTGTEARKIVLIDAEGRTHTGYQASIITEGSRAIEGYVPHFSTCPTREQFKRKEPA